jgi:hypothetical protein
MAFEGTYLYRRTTLPSFSPSKALRQDGLLAEEVRPFARTGSMVSAIHSQHTVAIHPIDRQPAVLLLLRPSRAHLDDRLWMLFWRLQVRSRLP